MASSEDWWYIICHCSQFLFSYLRTFWWQSFKRGIFGSGFELKQTNTGMTFIFSFCLNTNSEYYFVIINASALAIEGLWWCWKLYILIQPFLLFIKVPAHPNQKHCPQLWSPERQWLSPSRRQSLNPETCTSVVSLISDKSVWHCERIMNRCILVSQWPIISPIRICS